MNSRLQASSHNLKWRDSLGVPALLALLLLLCLLLYLPSLSYFFAQDDFYFLSRASQNRVEGFAAMLKPFGPFYRPLSTSMYFTAMLKLFGLWPLPYHIFNLILFCANALAVYYLGAMIFRDRAKGFVTALFYLTRGVHFETVSWVSGIQDSLMTLFTVLSMVAYLACSQKTGLRFLLSMGFFLLALLSKETALVFPLILVAYEVILNRDKANIRRYAMLLPLIFLAGAFLVFRILFVESMPAEGEYATGIGLFWISNLVKYLLACVNVWYLSITFFPKVQGYAFQFLAGCLALLLFVWLLKDRERRKGFRISDFGLGIRRFARLSGNRRKHEGVATNLLSEAGNTRIRGYLRLMGFGLVVSIIGAMPALPFTSRFEPYYMSLSCVGMSIVFSAAFASLSNRRARAGVLITVCVVALMLNMQIRARRLSHVGRFSSVAQRAINELKPVLASAPGGTTLYISGSDGNLYLALAWGDGIKVFFPQIEAVIFDNVSPEYQLKGTETVFRYASRLTS
ncbi:hypothetical protein HZA56_07060 [Candidatus Poribacteria bacterium]|nr:hypothetical protein [Candidatus Poribacteria bacterium]